MAEAFCPTIVVCSDTMISTDWTSTESGRKMVALPHGFMGLIAGPTEQAQELVQLYAATMSKQVPFTRDNALECLRKPLGEWKRRMAEAHLQNRLGISYREFLRTGQEHLPADVFNELSRDVLGLTSGVQLIIAGFFGNPYESPVLLNWEMGPCLYRISGDTVSEVDPFVCIGSGAFLAESSLYYREHRAEQTLDETLYAVYEAKRLGEKALGVGRATSMSILRWDRETGLTYLTLNPSALDKLEHHFRVVSRILCKSLFSSICSFLKS